MSPDIKLLQRATDSVFEVLKKVIQESHNCSSSGDVINRALLCFLVRVCNSWRSIRTLHENTLDEEGPMVDAGALLRAMFDAYLQAEYIMSDNEASVPRATDYLDFAHVERYKRAQKIIGHDNAFSEKLKQTPLRPAGEVTLQREYDRVKDKFYVEKKVGGKVKKGPGTRSNWYVGNLAEIARSVGKDDEYDILLANFHGCVHSSSLAVQSGPLISREHILDWASTIAARVAQLNVKHNSIVLTEFEQKVLDALSIPFFSDKQ